MSATRYVTGRNFEYRCRDDLKARGYYVVRSAGSKGKVDLCAFKGDVVLGIQCKLKGAITAAEKRAICSFSSNPHFIPVVAYSERQGRRMVVRYIVADTGEDFDPGEK